MGYFIVLEGTVAVPVMEKASLPVVFGVLVLFTLLEGGGPPAITVVACEVLPVFVLVKPGVLT